MEKAWKLISFNPWSFYLCAFIKHLSASGRGGSQGDSYTLMPSIATLLRSRTFCLIYKSWQMQPLIGLVSVDSQSATHFFDASVQFSSVQSLSRFRLFVAPWNAARQGSLSIISSWSLLKLMSMESVMPSSHLHQMPSPFDAYSFLIFFYQ